MYWVSTSRALRLASSTAGRADAPSAYAVSAREATRCARSTRALSRATRTSSCSRSRNPSISRCRASIRVVVTTPRRTLRLGESVFGEIAVETRPNAVVVPAESLVPDEGGYKVFVVDARGTAVARPVEIGGRTATKVEITAGLSGGETVVTKGAFGLEDSSTVGRPVRAKP